MRGTFPSVKLRDTLIKAARICGLALATAFATAGASLAQEAPPPLNAFAVWQGKGVIVQTGVAQASLTGAFGGLMFVESAEGPIEVGTVLCPGVIDIDLNSGQQRGSGACNFTAHDGARAFGVWDCAGVHLIGCRGDFRLTGGTDRLAGVTGSGGFLVRGRLHELAKTPGTLVDTAVGIALWRDLTMTMPAAK